MFGFNRKNKKAVLVPVGLASVPERQQVDLIGPSPDAAIIQRWMSLAEIQQRVIRVLTSEITRTSVFVESEADALSGRFQGLAISAMRQTTRVNRLTSLATGVDVSGEAVPLHEITALLEATLSDVVAKILLLSKDSMSMVYALNDLAANIERVGKCVAGIDAINKTTNMLAMNARIEAERAGTAGVAFRVVADEVRELSKSTQILAATMKNELKSVVTALNVGHATLERVATIDMSDNILARERLDQLLSALVIRNDNLESIVADAVAEAQTISSDVDGMVTGIQFQDRTRQRLEHVVDTLEVIDQAIEEIKQSTVAATPDLTSITLADMGWVKELLGRFTMSEMRERFVAQIIDGKPVEWSENGSDSAGSSSSGSAELF